MRRTPVKMPEFNWLNVNDKLTFLGSCFSVHMARASKEKGFDVLSNPFGVIFNPISIAKLIDEDQMCMSDSVFQTEDKFLSWNAHSEIWSTSESEIVETLNVQKEILLESIRKSNTLFITFGTAWIYELIENNTIVANCHKQSSKAFTKRCLTSEEIIKVWKPLINKLLETHTELKIVFTVSPVRHKKDGLIENNRSKAQLISAVHSLVENNDSSYYFPSYEFVIDELRDYAYFERDGVHPNKFCIDEVERLFFSSFLTGKAQSILEEFDVIRKMKSHRPIHPGTNSAREFEKSCKEREKVFLDNYPELRSYI